MVSFDEIKRFYQVYSASVSWLYLPDALTLWKPWTTAIPRENCDSSSLQLPGIWGMGGQEQQGGCSRFSTGLSRRKVTHVGAKPALEFAGLRGTPMGNACCSLLLRRDRSLQRGERSFVALRCLWARTRRIRLSAPADTNGSHRFPWELLLHHKTERAGAA